MLSLPRPGSPCRGGCWGSLWGVRWGSLGLGGRACGRCFIGSLLRCLNRIPDLCQRLAHLTDTAGQLGHGLADDVHAACHVPVHGHQVLAEFLEHLGLLGVGVEELPVKAHSGWAGEWLGGPAGGLGLG